MKLQRAVREKILLCVRRAPCGSKGTLFFVWYDASFATRYDEGVTAINNAERPIAR